MKLNKILLSLVLLMGLAVGSVKAQTPVIYVPTATPNAPRLTVNGNRSNGSYSYSLVCHDFRGGVSQPSNSASVSNAASPLTDSDNVTISWSNNCTSVDILKNSPFFAIAVGVTGSSFTDVGTTPVNYNPNTYTGTSVLNGNIVVNNTLNTSINSNTVAGATSIDMSQSNRQIATLNASANLTLVNPAIGRTLALDVVEGASGGFTPTFVAPSGYAMVWSTGTTPTLTTSAGTHNLYQFSVESGFITGALLGSSGGGGSTACGPELFSALPVSPTSGQTCTINDSTTCSSGTVVTGGSGSPGTGICVLTWDNTRSGWYPAGVATGALPNSTDVTCPSGATSCVVQGVNNTPIVGTQAANKLLATNSGNTQWNYKGFYTDPSTAVGDLYIGAAGVATPTVLPDVATGSVIKSGGVGVAPAFGTLTGTSVASTGASTLGTTNGALNYFSFGSGGASEPNQVWFPSKLITISNVSCYYASAPGASNSYAVGLDECDTAGANCSAVGTPSAISVAVSTTNHTGQDLTDSYTLTASHTYVFKSTLTVAGSAPTASTARCAFTTSVN